MVVALRGLRVSADMDAGKYVAGMKEKVAADKAGAASSNEVAQAMARTDRQAGQSGGVLGSLSRQFVTSYRGADDFEKAVSRLGRGIEKGAVPLDRVDTILEGIYKKYGLTANAAELLANGQTALGNAATQLNAKLALQEQAADGTALAHKRLSAAANDNGFKQKMLAFQLNDVFQSLALGMPLTQVALQQGPQIAQLYGPNEGGIGAAFRDTGKMITGVLTKFPLVTAAVATIGTAFAALTWEINKSTKVSVGFGDVALASVQVLGRYIWNSLKPAAESISPWFDKAWNGAVSGVKWAGNAIIASIVSAVQLVKSNIENIPASFRVAGEAAANGFIKAIEWMVNKALEGIKRIRDTFQSLIDWAGAGKAAEVLGFSGQLPDVPGSVNLGRVDFGGAAATTEMERRRQATLRRVGQNFDQDYLGSYYKDVRAQSIKNALDDKKKGGGDRESDYERTIRRLKEQTEAAREDTRVIDLSTYARERQSAVQDILTAAQRDGMEIGKAFANAQELINASSSSLSPKLAAERERILAVAGAYAQAQADAEKAEEAQRKFKEAMEFAKETTRGFIDDFRGALKQGGTVWEAFAEAAMNALDRITDKLLDEVMDAIFQVNKAGAGSGGGGGLFGWIGSLFGGGSSFAQLPSTGPVPLARPNALGDVYRSRSLSAYSNSIVDRPTYFAFAKGAGLMGEAGPEAIMPLRRDATGRLGVSASGAWPGAANDNGSISRSIIQISLSPELLAKVLEEAKGQSIEIVKQNNAQNREIYMNGDAYAA